MKILALEFSSPQRSVAVADSAAALRSFQNAEVIETAPQSTEAFSMIDRALIEAGFEREHIECLAIGLGPGSYTGIRAAIALAQGWQLVRPVKLLGISSAEAIAARAFEEGVTGPVAVVIDAQRSEFYLAPGALHSSGRSELEPLRLASVAEVKQCQARGCQLIGPCVSQWFPSARAVYPRAATLARLAVDRENFIPGERLEPIYLRETQFVKAAPPRTFPVK